MYMRAVSMDAGRFHLPECKECLLAFSRVLFNEEIVVAYNISASESRTEYVEVEHNGDKVFEYLWGDTGQVQIHATEDMSRNYIQLALQPQQFVILQRQISEVI